MIRLGVASVAFVGFGLCDASDPVAWGFGAAFAVGVLLAGPRQRRVRRGW